MDYPLPRPSFKIPNTLEGTSHSHLSVDEFTGNFLLERRTQNNKKNLGHCRESAAPEGNWVSPESSGRRGQTQTCHLQNIVLAQREPAVLTGGERLRLCWVRPWEVVRQEVSPAPETVHLSGPYKDTAPRVSASTSFKARGQSAAEITLQLLFCQSGEGIRKPGAN